MTATVTPTCARCDHLHTVPWRTCDTETQCDALAREDERTWGR